MRPAFAVLIMLLSILPAAHAADADSGKAKAVAVCAACHGATGVSVTDTIPNLAGQKRAYLEVQLRAWKDGSRKNPLMNAIAAQLSAEDITGLAAYFSAQPGAAATTAKSDFLPNLAKTSVTFPEDYQKTYTKYHTINFPATGQVRYYFANNAALQAAKEGKTVPNGAMLFVEVHAARLGPDKKPVTGPDGFFVPEKLLFYTAMARDAGWGKDIPEILRNEDWNYAIFTTAKQHRPAVNQAECLACHKPLDKVSYLFTLKQIAEAGKSK